MMMKHRLDIRSPLTLLTCRRAGFVGVVGVRVGVVVVVDVSE